MKKNVPSTFTKKVNARSMAIFLNRYANSTAKAFDDLEYSPFDGSERLAGSIGATAYTEYTHSDAINNTQQAKEKIRRERTAAAAEELARTKRAAYIKEEERSRRRYEMDNDDDEDLFWSDDEEDNEPQPITIKVDPYAHLSQDERKALTARLEAIAARWEAFGREKGLL